MKQDIRSMNSNKEIMTITDNGDGTGEIWLNGYVVIREGRYLTVNDDFADTDPDDCALFISQRAAKDRIAKLGLHGCSVCKASCNVPCKIEGSEWF